jgi:MFS family permease
MRFRPTVPSVLTRVPLAKNYPAAVITVLLALSPFLVLTTVTTLASPVLMRALHATTFELRLASAMSNAGYAFGAVATADLIQRMPRRRVYLLAEAGFVLGSVLVLSARGIEQFIAGAILQGAATGMLLIAALPPLILRHGIERLPTTAAVISVGFFGLVTLGPLVGGLVGQYGGWRALYAAIAVVAAVGLALGVLTFEQDLPLAPGARFDWWGIPQALGTAFLPFFGVSWLTRSSWSDPVFLVPVFVGLLLGVTLVVAQYHARNALMPVRIIVNTLPVSGTITAMAVGAAFTTLLELSETYLLQTEHYSPVRAGGVLTPMIIGVVVASLLFKGRVTTKWIPVFALSGALGVVAGGAMLLAVDHGNAAVLFPAAGVLLGYGAGAGVTPGLFLAGFSVPSTRLGPTFALVELARSEAAFLVGPVLVHVAQTQHRAFADGFRLAVTITLAMTVLAILVVTALWAAGGARLRTPDLEGWTSGRGTGFHSPPIAARFRRV